MFYPEDSLKANWDLFITVILVYTCIATPARIAFTTEDTLGWSIIKWVTDLLFLADIIIIFFSATQDDDFRTNDDRKQIAKDYIFGWLLLDIFAIVPFQEIFMIFGKSNNQGGS